MPPVKPTPWVWDDHGQYATLGALRNAVTRFLESSRNKARGYGYDQRPIVEAQEQVDRLTDDVVMASSKGNPITIAYPLNGNVEWPANIVIFYRRNQ